MTEQKKPQPGEGWRLLQETEDDAYQEGDQYWWDGKWHDIPEEHIGTTNCFSVIHHRRRIEQPDLGHGFTESTSTRTVRLFVPRRVLDEETVDYPVRCCWSQGEIKDAATWIEVFHDGKRFFVKEGQ